MEREIFYLAAVIVNCFLTAFVFWVAGILIDHDSASALLIGTARGTSGSVQSRHQLCALFANHHLSDRVDRY